jgi:adenine-specific DNA-methyltransferase
LQNLYQDLETLLSEDADLVDEHGKLNKNVLITRAANLDDGLLARLISSEAIKRQFFTTVGDTLVFDKAKFQEFIANKAFLPDSYTAFRNKIGLTDRSGRFLSASEDVVLAWPYKDCVLEGGMTKEDVKRDEIFWNTTLAPDDITRLFEPKALTGLERWDAEAVAQGKSKPVERIDPEKDNLLIKGNNLLALHSLKQRYGGKIDCIYIDPPYNPPSGSNTFLYNNRFNHSSWLTFMKNRLEAAKFLLKRDGSMIVAIDENEFFALGVMVPEIFPDHEIHFISIVHNPRGVQGTNFSYINEYALFVIPKNQKSVGDRKIDAEEVDWANLRNWGTESERSDAKNCFYAVKVKDGKIVGFGDVLADDVHPDQTVENGDEFEVYPIDSKGVERKWRYARQSVEEIKHLLRAVWRNGHYEIELGKDFGMMRTVWFDSRYDANGYGTQLLKQLVPGCEFTFPKSVWTVHDCIQAVVGNSKSALILDFFGGSGTTGHAVLELNKADGGARKFIMAEQLDYVRTCTRQRIIEVMKRDALQDVQFIYAELATANEAFAARIRNATNDGALAAVAADLREKGWWRYKVDQSLWDWDEWEALAFNERKQLLLDSLDANHLYVNYADIDDADTGLSAHDIAVTKAFYEGEK